MNSPAKKPVYLRGIPSDVVREAKAAAARRGVTLAGYVADALARAVRQREDRDGSAEPADDLDDDLRWYERNRDKLARDYDGEYVAIVGRRVVDHDASFEALAERVFAAHGVRNILMPRVGARQPLRVRSPRLARTRRG